ncbi:MAG TPA: serine/threonine-protein kinase [Fimbriiglobus sp.]|nr:serine/threonine-protein kinase [Fimbriiglobus sp.]
MEQPTPGTPAPCPHRQLLLDFASGRLADPQRQVVADHAATCARCGLTLRNLAQSDDAASAPTREVSGASPGRAPYATTIPGGVAPIAAEPRAEQSIGPYKLVQKLGEGGMGEVWAAVQEHPVKRRVALKLVKAGMDSDQVIARFEAERQALALMDHTNIARVYDAGAAPSGRPYFAMELVKGVPITTYCDELGLGVRERLGLFVPVCQAVQHAHQKGVIHRDLKPSNVLVGIQDGNPVPKVIDFGVAKALYARLGERTMYTEIGAVVGTLEYMAPEQAELSALDVDTRADVYALGALLYELLTGVTPLARDVLRTVSLVEALRMIREVDPPRPSTRLGAARDLLPARSPRPRGEVRGELDWIVMKCLEKDRTRRYETANGLARDLQRFLADEPVEAGPPSRWYRCRKFCRRNRGAVIGASILVLALAGGAVGTTVGLIRATDAEATARQERDRAREALAGETAARQEATEALDAATGAGLDTLFSRQSTIGDREKRYLRNLLALHEQAAARRGETEEARALAARGRLRVARILSLLGEREEAEAAYRKALPEYRRLAEDFPGVPLYRREWGICHLYLGELLGFKDLRAQAETEFRHARDVHDQLTRAYSEVPLYWRDLWGDTFNLGLLLMSRGDLAGAEPLLREALAIAGRLADRRPAEPAPGRWADEVPFEPLYRVYFGNSHQMLGVLLAKKDQRADAVRHFRESHAVYERLIRDYPFEWEYLWGASTSYTQAGNYLASGPGAAGAEEALRRAVELNEQLVSALPAVPAYRLGLAYGYRSLGHFLRDRGDHREAAALAAKALPVAEGAARDRTHAAEARRLVDGLIADLDRASRASGQPDLAEVPLRDLLRARQRTDGAESSAATDVAAELGLCLVRQRKYADAEPLLRGCIAAGEKARPGDWRTDWAKALLGGALLGAKRHADAGPLLAAGYDGLRRHEGALPAHTRPRVGEVLDWLVRHSDETGRTAEATRWRAERAKFMSE